MAAFTACTTAEEVCNIFSKEIRGKSIPITGVTQGSIGAEVALRPSHHPPSKVTLAGRSLAKLRATESVLKTAVPSVNTRLLELDLSSQKQVCAASKEVNAYAEPIDRLINNAAIMAVPYARTVDGLESQLGTNHIGHFLFTNLIMPKILAAGKGARIINVSSSGHKRSPFRFNDYNFEDGKTYDKWAAYGQTKTANMLFSVSLADKLGPKGLLSYSLYPGRIKTNIAQSIPLEELRAAGWMDEHGNVIQDPKLGWKTLPEGAATTVAAAFDPSIADQNGAYLVHCKVAPVDAEPYALDEENAAKLWKLSEETSFHILVFGSNLRGPVNAQLKAFSSALENGFYTEYGKKEVFNIVLVTKCLRFEIEERLADRGLAALRETVTVVFDDRSPDEDAHYVWGIDHSKGAVVVVRPDLWVGMSAYPNQPTELDGYFRQFLLPVKAEANSAPVDGDKSAHAGDLMFGYRGSVDAYTCTNDTTNGELKPNGYDSEKLKNKIPRTGPANGFPSNKGMDGDGLKLEPEVDGVTDGMNGTSVKDVGSKFETNGTELKSGIPTNEPAGGKTSGKEEGEYFVAESASVDATH